MDNVEDNISKSITSVKRSVKTALAGNQGSTGMASVSNVVLATF